MALISIEKLQSLSYQALTAVGLDPTDAQETVRHYLHNEISGKSSHGIVRVVEAAKAIQNYPVVSPSVPKIEREQDTVSIYDCTNQIAPPAIHTCLGEALKKSAGTPISFLGVRGYIASSGSLSYYLRHVTDHNIIGLMGCNSVALVAPPEGRKRQIGTNPFGIGIPSSGDPALIADFATSAIAYGKIMVAGEKEEPIPDGVLIDKDGNPSTDPKDAYEGAILPLEGHKGFALGLLIELLAGSLIGAKSIKDNLYDNDGFFAILINPALLSGNTHILDLLKNNFETLLASPPRNENQSVQIAGMRSQDYYDRNTSCGELNIPDNLLNKLKEFVS